MVIEETHQKGMEIPEKLRHFMKNSKACRQLNIDAKLIADPRQRAKTRKKNEEREEKEFREKTGQVDNSKVYTLEMADKLYRY